MTHRSWCAIKHNQTKQLESTNEITIIIEHDEGDEKYLEYKVYIFKFYDV